jgi:hypothetical protein
VYINFSRASLWEPDSLMSGNVNYSIYFEFLTDISLFSFNKITEGILAFIYSISAPIGIAIGVGIYHTYNPAGRTANLVQGTFDAVR